MESKKYNKLVYITKKMQMHRYREETGGYQRGEGSGEEEYRGRSGKGLLWDYMKPCV